MNNPANSSSRYKFIPQHEIAYNQRRMTLLGVYYSQPVGVVNP